ncbi:MAG: hypothetical protein HQ565_10160 [Bacteroidetes bacterium]|nr:hypothetical protein [Bacteroidota bacterium]
MKTDTKILKFLYSNKNNGNYYDVSKHMKHKSKPLIDKYVVDLENNGYVEKEVEGYLPASAIPPGGNMDHANNSICKITPKGIDYFENQLKIGRNTLLTILALAVSFLSALFTALTYYNN